MKFLPLIWAGVWRRPGRTILIVLQVAVAFVLFGVLQGMKTGIEAAIGKTRADLLLVFSNAFGGPPLPMAYLDKLRPLAGVKQTTFADGILGTYQKPDQPVYVFAIAPDAIWLTLLPEMFKILPRDLEALRTNRTGALISPDLAAKYGWKVGDRIPLNSVTLNRDGSGSWVFDVVGMFTPHEVNGGGTIVVNYTYLDESRVTNKGTVRNFYVVTVDPRSAAVVSEAIDKTFANSASETSTASLRESAQQTLQRMGDMNFMVRAILTPVFGALLFSIGTLLMRGIRERSKELAVLKTLGFTDLATFLLILAEAGLVCVSGSLIGLGLAMLAFPYTAKWIPGLSMPLVVVTAGVLIACLVALLSAALPARRAARLRVVDALAGR